MNDHLGKGNIDASTVRVLVIDEFDKCLEFGFQEEMSDVIGKLPNLRETLYKLVCSLGSEQTLVFCNHRESVDRVGKYLHSMKVYSETFHGGMGQDDRERALYKFRNGSCNIFISTDLAARGLDISGIKNVVHYHLPIAEDGFIHRNGRTARWDAEGSAYIICVHFAGDNTQTFETGVRHIIYR